MDVEKALDKTFAPGERKYINKVRSIKFNLSDLENELAIKIINGDMPPADLVHKETHELASEAKKKEQEAVLAEHQAASRTDLGMELQAKNAKEGLFKCGKCKKNKCAVFQMQTRGADEPMTNFVTCLSCGHN
jgi:transcription elongation factor S-II